MKSTQLAMEQQLEQQEEQLDPNLNAEAYRNLTSADRLLLRDSQLEVILVYNDDSLVLGASNMIHRYWNGTVWFYNSPNYTNGEDYTASIRTQSGVRVAAYLDKHNKFVIGEDSGSLQIYEALSDSETLHCIDSKCQHDDSLTSVSTFNNHTYIVTAGMDSCIKVWDTSEMLVINNYNQAQVDIVTNVEVQSGSDNIFISTSMDTEALLWDTRKSKPALELWKKAGCGLTAAAWEPDNENIVAIGGIDGSISILDIRKLGGSPIFESIEFSRGVKKLLFNPGDPNQLAGCCDATEVKVFKTSDNCRMIFENNAHTDFVRGLAWHQSDLLTCSWDSTVCRHSIPFE